jgi:enamine deaminase RidA (YjgF/YER057c/UK114 family)
MNSLISSKEEKSVAATIAEAVESTDLGETSGGIVESVEAGAAQAQVEEAVESIDAALDEQPPATN